MAKICRHCGKEFKPSEVKGGAAWRIDFQGAGKAAAAVAAGKFRLPRARIYCSDNCRVRAFRARNSDAGFRRSRRPGGGLVVAPSANPNRRMKIVAGRLVAVRGRGDAAAAAVDAGLCQAHGCGKKLAWSGRGRPPRFCSSACNLRAWRAEKSRAA